MSAACEEDASTHTLLDHLVKLKEKLEKDQNWDTFEFFEYPYVVKKRVAYSFRILARVCEVSVQQKRFQVLVFLRLYKRGDKDYDLLFIGAKTQGDSIYHTQKIQELLPTYVQSRLKQPKQQLSEQNRQLDLSDLGLIKINPNNLGNMPSNLLYQEKVSWVWHVRPLLSGSELSMVYQHLYEAFEAQCDLNFEVSGHQLSFKAINDQYQLSTLVGQNELNHLDRYIPLDSLLSERLWIQHQRIDLPLYYFNQLQKILANTWFNAAHSSPLIANTSHGSGKTTFLSAVASQMLIQSPITEDIKPVLFLCQLREKKYIHYQVQQSLSEQLSQQNDGDERQETYASAINQCCTTLHDFIFASLNNQQKVFFEAVNYVDEIQFNRLWQRSALKSNSTLSAKLCWNVIKYLIKGVNEDHEALSFRNSLNEYSSLTRSTFDYIYKEVWQKWYRLLAKQNNYWDEEDLVAFTLNQNIQLPSHSLLLVDDAQLYSKNTFQLLIQCNHWVKNYSHKDITYWPFIFLGDQQAARPSLVHKWVVQLSEVLCQFTDQEPSLLLSMQIDESHLVPHWLNQQLLNQRLKLKILNGRKEKSMRFDGSGPKLFFVEQQNLHQIQALLASKQAQFVINTPPQNIDQYLKTNQTFSFIYQDVHDSQLNLPIHSVHTLKDKTASVVLMGFYHYLFSEFANPEINLADLSYDARYELDHCLNLITCAMQQGQTEIFIVGQASEYPIWQFLLDPNNEHLHQASLDHIYAGFNSHIQYLSTQHEKLEHRYDLVEAQNLAQLLLNGHQYQRYYRLKALMDFKANQYAEYFAHSKTDKQNEWMIARLWQDKKVSILLQYADKFGVSVRSNLHALTFITASRIDGPLLMSLPSIFKQYVIQHNEPQWNVFWPELLERIFSKICGLKNNHSKEWQPVQNIIIQLKPSGLIVPYEVQAYIAYYLQDEPNARLLWQQARDSVSSYILPEEYYLILSRSDNVFDRLNANIKLKKTGELMNELSAIDLNHLNLDVWDQVLNYLDDTDELKPVIKQLLPLVHSQEILEKLYRFCKNHTSDNFAHRIQRFKTMQACLNSQWPIIEERLEFFVPIQDQQVAIKRLAIAFNQVAQFKPKKNGKAQNHKNTPTTHFNEELLDILYALNLNPNLKIAEDQESLQHYQADESIQLIYGLIRKNFAATDQSGGYVWRYNFAAIRSLCGLLEKSPQLLDTLTVYDNILSFNPAPVLQQFALERLSVLIPHIKALEPENDEVQNCITSLEIKYKKSLLAQVNTSATLEFPVLKTEEEIIKSILALTNKENAELQREEQEEIKAQKKEIQESKQKEKALEQAEHAERLRKEREIKLAEQQKLAQEQEELNALGPSLSETLINDVDEALITIPADVAADLMNKETAVAAEPIESDLIQKNISVDLKTESVSPPPVEELELSSTQRLTNEVDIGDKKQHSSSELTTAADLLVDVNAVVNHAPSIANQLNAIVNNNQSTDQTALEQSATRIYVPVTELSFFGLRIFISRMHKRINIEDQSTGERWSLNALTMAVQSDWPYEQCDNQYIIPKQRLVIDYLESKVLIEQLDEGISLTLHL